VVAERPLRNVITMHCVLWIVCSSSCEVHLVLPGHRDIQL
jgi:hypothetical protein